MTDNIFGDLINAFDPIVGTVLDLLPPPINWVVGFIWGGLREVILEVMF